MFSFRTTPLLEQEDLTLRRGRLAVLDDDTAWHPGTGEYLFYTLARYRNAVRLYCLEDTAVLAQRQGVLAVPNAAFRFTPNETMVPPAYKGELDKPLDIDIE